MLQLFATILVFGEPASPGDLWREFEDNLIEDYLHQLNAQFTRTLEYNREDAVRKALRHLLALLEPHGKNLCDFEGIPEAPDDEPEE